MHLVKFTLADQSSPRWGWMESQQGPIHPFVDQGAPTRLVDLLQDRDLAERARSTRVDADTIALDDARLLAPLDDQEVWGAGVTYLRSKTARQEESPQGANFYDLVYSAARPELFFKASPHRVVNPGGPIMVRRDTRWCVPEPELALVLAPDLRLVGCTVGNDVSARDIEGENPLYLPQAKVYDGCCALGPWITLIASMPERSSIGIGLRIRRDGREVTEGETSIARMARSFEEIIDWLGRDNSFPTGVIVLTGTGIVPDDTFSLETGDEVEIRIDGIGTLTNTALRHR